MLKTAERRHAVSSGYIPPKGEPDPGEIFEALQEALDDNPRLAQMPTEEVARQLVVGGYLKGEPSLPLVAEASGGVASHRGRGG
jgi:hypothetical protein